MKYKLFRTNINNLIMKNSNANLLINILKVIYNLFL